MPGAFNYRLPFNPVRWSRAIDALEPDLIEIGDAFHPAWAAANVANRRGIPLIAFYHSNFPQLAGRRLGTRRQKFIEWYVRLTYERCEQVLAPSRYMCDYLHSIGVKHATVQPLGVDVDTFNPERRSRDLRAELRSAARHAPAGVRRALLRREEHSRARSRLSAGSASPYHLLLIGGGEAGARRQRHAHSVLPRQSRRSRSYFASADAFVHAGTHETFGLVVLEAMACGRPVVAMRAGAIPELVDEQCRRAGRAARGPGRSPPRISPAAVAGAV